MTDSASGFASLFSYSPTGAETRKQKEMHLIVNFLFLLFLSCGKKINDVNNFFNQMKFLL